MFWFIRVAVLVLAMLSAPDAFAWSGQVVDVHDGDSLRVQRDDGEVLKVRIYGVDCPELGQPYGNDARELTAQLVLGQRVEVVPTGQRPSYGREVALVSIPGRGLLQEELVTAGLAWVDGRYCKNTVCDYWRIRQQDAKIAVRGLWAEGSPIAPWVWRRFDKPKGSKK